MCKKEYSIVVFNNNIDDTEFGLSEARKIYFSETKKDVEIEVIFSEVEFVEEDFIKALDIINEHNSSMIGLDEDDVIYSERVKQLCFSDLQELCDRHNCSPKIVQIKELIFNAIQNRKNIYFLF